MKIHDSTGKELMDVASIRRDGNTLVLKGKIFGTMPMVAKLTPEEARKGFKLLTPSTLIFLLTFIFRRSK